MFRVFTFALLMTVAALGQAAPPKMTGVFTSMRFGTEDLSGVEVFITLSDRGYFVQVQCAEGAVSSPVVVPAVVSGSSVQFDLPAGPGPNIYSCPSGRFIGKASASGMKGHFEGTDWPGFLRRKRSYWQ